MYNSDVFFMPIAYTAFNWWAHAE